MNIAEIEEIVSKIEDITYSAARPYAASGDAGEIAAEVAHALRAALAKHVTK
jgi:hypothetical protein